MKIIKKELARVLAELPDSSGRSRKWDDMPYHLQLTYEGQVDRFFEAIRILEKEKDEYMDTYEKLELGNELLHDVAVQLTQWSHDPETSGRQHQPMENLAIKIFNHLKACQPADTAELPEGEEIMTDAEKLKRIGDWVKVNPELCGEAFLNDRKINIDHKGVIIGWNWDEGDPKDNPKLAQVLWEDGCHFTLHWHEDHLILCDSNEIPIKFKQTVEAKYEKAYWGLYRVERKDVKDG